DARVRLLHDGADSWDRQYRAPTHKPCVLWDGLPGRRPQQSPPTLSALEMSLSRARFQCAQPQHHAIGGLALSVLPSTSRCGLMTNIDTEAKIGMNISPIRSIQTSQCSGAFL